MIHHFGWLVKRVKHECCSELKNFLGRDILSRESKTETY